MSKSNNGFPVSQGIRERLSGRFPCELYTKIMWLLACWLVCQQTPQAGRPSPSERDAWLVSLQPSCKQNLRFNGRSTATCAQAKPQT